MEKLQCGIPHTRRLGWGYVTAPATIDDGSGRHDLRTATWKGPAADWNGHLQVIDHNARFFLLVEKYNGFARLVQDGFHLTNACVLATGNGYPGTGFRALIRRLYEQLNVPLYVLADNDPA